MNGCVDAACGVPALEQMLETSDIDRYRSLGAELQLQLIKFGPALRMSGLESVQLAGLPTLLQVRPSAIMRLAKPLQRLRDEQSLHFTSSQMLLEDVYCRFCASDDAEVDELCLETKLSVLSMDPEAVGAEGWSYSCRAPRAIQFRKSQVRLQMDFASMTVAVMLQFEHRPFVIELLSKPSIIMPPALRALPGDRISVEMDLPLWPEHDAVWCLFGNKVMVATISSTGMSLSCQVPPVELTGGGESLSLTIQVAFGSP